MVHDVVAGVAAEVLLPAAHAVDARHGERIQERAQVIPVAADRLLHPHPLVAQVRRAVGRLPVAHREAAPQVAREQRPVALDRATAALADLRIPDHVRARERRDLLRVGREPAAGRPADILHQRLLAVAGVLHHAAIEIPRPAIRADHILLVNGIVDAGGQIGRAVSLDDAVRTAGNIVVMVLPFTEEGHEQPRAKAGNTQCIS